MVCGKYSLCTPHGSSKPRVGADEAAVDDDEFFLSVPENERSAHRLRLKFDIHVEGLWGCSVSSFDRVAWIVDREMVLLSVISETVVLSLWVSEHTL